MVTFAVPDKLTAEEIRTIRRKLGLTRAEFARLANVSKKTVERWEAGEREIGGPIAALVKLLWEYPQVKEELTVPDKKYPLRL